MSEEPRPDLLAILLQAGPDGRLRRALFGALLLSFAFFGATPSWNPNSRFDLVRAIVEQQTLRIDTYHQNTGDKSVHGGHYYSDKAPGISFLAVPWHALVFGARLAAGRPPAPTDKAWARGSLYLSTLLTVGLLAAAGAVALYSVATALGASRSRALLVTVAYAVGTPAFTYSSLFFSHQAAAALLFLAFAAALRSREPSAALPGAPILIGALLGLATICEYPCLLGALAVGGYFLSLAHARGALVRSAAALLAGAAPFAVLAALYNWACFGAPWHIGYSALVESRFSIGMSRALFGVGLPTPTALWGITFGGMRGLFVMAPVMLLALAGLVWAARRASWRHEARLCLILFGAFLMLNAGYSFWDGGASYGPRHMVAALPFLALGLVALPQGRLTGALFAVLALVSVANAVAAAGVGADLPEWGNALTRHIWPAVLENRIPSEPGAYNLGMVIGLKGSLGFLPLLAFWGLAFPAILGLAREAEKRS